MSPNIGTLLNGVLIPKLLNSLFIFNKFCFFTVHIAHFDNTIVLPLLLFETLGFMFSVSFLHFKQYDFILNIVLKII